MTVKAFPAAGFNPLDLTIIDYDGGSHYLKLKFQAWCEVIPHRLEHRTAMFRA